MFEIKLDDSQLKELYMAEIRKKIEKLEHESLLMDTKQLCKYLSLSWPTVEKLFLSDPSFPSMRIGKKWLFNRKLVQEYVNRWSIEIKNNA